MLNTDSVNGWPHGFAFILSFLAPLWTICESFFRRIARDLNVNLGSFDSSVHISEEATNAATVVPWAIVYAIGIAGVLGWGTLVNWALLRQMLTFFLAINMVLAFCMGSDIQSLLDSDQPMAQIFHNSFGQKPTLAIWAIVVVVQYVLRLYV